MLVVVKVGNKFANCWCLKATKSVIKMMVPPVSSVDGTMKTATITMMRQSKPP